MGVNGERGFTLIEMLVSCLMISIALLGVYSSVTRYTQQAKQVRENFTATLLGQEGVELVRNVRDYNWVDIDEDTVWDHNLTNCEDCSGANGGCYADYLTDVNSPLPVNFPNYTDSGYLYVKNGFYGYDSTGGATRTPFRRQICIEEDADILHITVYVRWASHTTTVKEDIYKWLPE